MGLFTTLLTLPVSGPIKTALWVNKKIYDLASAEYDDPAFIRKQLAALEERLVAGEMTEDEFEEIELTLLHRLKDAQIRASAVATARR